jgi:hypothetical protein
MIDYTYHKIYLEDKLLLLKNQYDRYNFEIKIRHNYFNNRLHDKMNELSIGIEEVEKELEGLKWHIREEKINKILYEK